MYAKVRPGASEARITTLAKGLVPLVALLAVYITFRGGATLVALLLMGYNIVTQLFPALVLSLPRRPLATRGGALAGILAGEATVTYLTLSHHTMATLFPSWPAVVTDLNVGIVALVANVVVLGLVSAVGRRSEGVVMEPAR